jgi:hypothetical protein
MTLYVKIKNVFGRELLYPDCQESKFLCELCNSQTITDSMKRILIDNGYKLAVKPQEIAFVR